MRIPKRAGTVTTTRRPRRLARFWVAMIFGVASTFALIGGGFIAAQPAFAVSNYCHLPQAAGPGSGYLYNFNRCGLCNLDADQRVQKDASTIFYCTYNPGNGKTDLHRGNNGYTGCALPREAGPGSGYSRNYTYCQDCLLVAVDNDYNNRGSHFWYCTYNPNNGMTDLHYG